MMRDIKSVRWEAVRTEWGLKTMTLPSERPWVVLTTFCGLLLLLRCLYCELWIAVPFLLFALFLFLFTIDKWDERNRPLVKDAYSAYNYSVLITTAQGEETFFTRSSENLMKAVEANSMCNEIVVAFEHSLQARG